MFCFEFVDQIGMMFVRVVSGVFEHDLYRTPFQLLSFLCKICIAFKAWPGTCPQAQTWLGKHHRAGVRGGVIAGASYAGNSAKGTSLNDGKYRNQCIICYFVNNHCYYYPSYDPYK